MLSRFRFLMIVFSVAVVPGCSDGPVAVRRDQSTMPSALPVNALNAANSVLLGDELFNDVDLSVHRNQSCATCHEPSEGFAAARSGVPVLGSAIQGSVAGKFGARKPPTAAYATLTPAFSARNGGVGGLFWDGRATGAVLGTPAADQALGPFLNPVEQALPDAACLVYRVRHSSYVNLYLAAWNGDILSIAFPSNVETTCSTPVAVAGNYVTLSAADRQRVTAAYHNAARSVADYEATFNKFSSAADAGTLTPLEREGLKLFSTKAKCQQCHTNKDVGAVFTDFRFHNLGVPRNPANIAFNYNTGAFDPGLGGVTGNTAHLGKFRTPTTRNVDVGVNRSYMHNGVLKSLKQVVDFYNTRDVLPQCGPGATRAMWGVSCWPAAEVPENVNTSELGDLGLSQADEAALVAFLRTLSDGFMQGRRHAH